MSFAMTSSWLHVSAPGEMGKFGICGVIGDGPLPVLGVNCPHMMSVSCGPTPGDMHPGIIDRRGDWAQASSRGGPCTAAGGKVGVT